MFLTWNLSICFYLPQRPQRTQRGDHCSRHEQFLPSLCSCRSLEEVQYPSCSLAPFLCALCVPCGRPYNRCALVRNSIDILQAGACELRELIKEGRCERRRVCPSNTASLGVKHAVSRRGVLEGCYEPRRPSGRTTACFGVKHAVVRNGPHGGGGGEGEAGHIARRRVLVSLALLC